MKNAIKLSMIKMTNWKNAIIDQYKQNRFNWRYERPSNTTLTNLKMEISCIRKKIFI